MGCISWVAGWSLTSHTRNILLLLTGKGNDTRRKRWGHTVLGCLIGRTLCYNEGRCMVFLVYVFSHAWKFGQISGRRVIFDKRKLSIDKKKSLRSYRLRCSRRLKRRPQDGMGQECDFCGYGPISITVAERALRITPGPPCIIWRCCSPSGPRSSPLS